MHPSSEELKNENKCGFTHVLLSAWENAAVAARDSQQPCSETSGDTELRLLQASRAQGDQASAAEPLPGWPRRWPSPLPSGGHGQPRAPGTFTAPAPLRGNPPLSESKSHLVTQVSLLRCKRVTILTHQRKSKQL